MTKSSSLLHWWYQRLGVGEHERPRVEMLWSLRFLYQIGLLFVWMTLLSLWVSDFGVEGLLYFFLIDSGIFLLASLGHIFIAQKCELDNYLLTVLGAALFLGGVALMQPQVDWWFFVFALLGKNLAFLPFGLGLMTKNESLLSPEQAQRLLPILDSAITVGTVMGSVLFLQLLPLWELQWLLVVWLVSIVLAMILIVWGPVWLGNLPPIKTYKPAKKLSIITETVNAICKTPFLRYLGGLVLLEGALWVIMDFSFINYVADHVAHSTGNGVDMAGLQANLLHDSWEKIATTAEHFNQEVIMHETVAHALGWLSLIFGLVALLIQLVLAHRSLNRFGVIRNMTIFFTGFLGVLLLFLGGAVSMNVVRGFQHGLHSLHEIAYHVSFYSIFSHQRNAIRQVFEGILRPLGAVLVCGSMLLVPWLSLDLMSLLPIWMIVMAGMMAIITVLMKQSFTDISKQNLHISTDIEAQMHAIEVLSQKGHFDAVLMLSDKLLHKNSHDIVRQKILLAVSKISDPRALPAYLQILHDAQESNKIKTFVLQSLLELRNLNDFFRSHVFSYHRLLHFLENCFSNRGNCQHLRKFALINLLQHLPTEKVVPFFMKILNEKDEFMTSICLRSSANIFADPSAACYLSPYLHDASPRLRGHAVIALWGFLPKEELRICITDLLTGRTPEEKIAAIYAIGEVRDHYYREQVYKLSEDKNQLVSVHSLVALSKLNDDRCVEPLLSLICGDDKKLAQRTLSMLQRSDPRMHERLQKMIQLEVFKRVHDLLPQQDGAGVDSQSLSKATVTKIKEWYALAERYDDMIVLEARYQQI